MIVLVLAAVSAVFGLPRAGKRRIVTLPGMVRTARFGGLFFGGLFAGFLLAVLVIELAVRRFDASVYTQVRHVELAGLDVLASATLLPALAATALLIVADRKRRRTFWLTLTALFLLLFAFVISLLINVPINTEQLAWTVQTPPAHWVTARDRWQLSHVARTGAAILALGCLAAAALITNSGGPAERMPGALTSPAPAVRAARSGRQ
jgi:Domain of unknown function (DUF1772)